MAKNDSIPEEDEFMDKNDKKAEGYNFRKNDISIDYCPYCKHKVVVSNGTAANGKYIQFRCKNSQCHKKHFSISTTRAPNKETARIKALQLYLEGVDITRIASLLGYTGKTVRGWVRPIKNLKYKDPTLKLKEDKRNLYISETEIYTRLNKKQKGETILYRVVSIELKISKIFPPIEEEDNSSSNYNLPH